MTGRVNKNFVHRRHKSPLGYPFKRRKAGHQLATGGSTIVDVKALSDTAVGGNMFGEALPGRSGLTIQGIMPGADTNRQQEQLHNCPPETIPHLKPVNRRTRKPAPAFGSAG